MRQLFSIITVVGLAALGLREALRVEQVEQLAGHQVPVSAGRAPSTPGESYLNLSREQKVKAVQSRLQLLTSAAPGALGSLRDEVALYCDEPLVVDAVLSAFASRAHLSRFEAVAFGDIFERVKNARFIEPIIQMFQSAEPQARAKAVRAAATQADPRLTEYLDEIFDQASRGGYRGSGTRERVILAAEKCGGELASAIFRKGLMDPALNVASYAADVVGKKHLRQFIPDLRVLIRRPDPHLKIRSAMSLARMHAAEGERILIDLLDPRDQTMAADAASAIREVRLLEAIPALKNLLPLVKIELRVAFAGTLVVLGDDPTLEMIVGDLQHANELRRSAAITVVAAAGAADLRATLESAIDAFGPGCYQGVSLGLTWSPSPDLELVKKMIRLTSQPRDLMDVVIRLGDQLVPWLQQELAATARRNLSQAQKEQRYMGLIVMLARIETPLARKALLASRAVHPRLVGEGLRQMDLRFRRLGVTP